MQSCRVSHHHKKHDLVCLFFFFFYQREAEYREGDKDDILPVEAAGEVLLPVVLDALLVVVTHGARGATQFRARIKLFSPAKESAVAKEENKNSV